MNLPPGYTISVKFSEGVIDYLSVSLVLPDRSRHVLVSMRRRTRWGSYTLVNIMDPYVVKDLSWDEVIQEFPDTLRRVFDKYVVHIISGAK